MGRHKTTSSLHVLTSFIATCIDKPVIQHLLLRDVLKKLPYAILNIIRPNLHSNTF